MICIKEIEGKFPKWKWWQVILGVVAIIVSTNVGPIEMLQLIKEVLKAWLGD